MQLSPERQSMSSSHDPPGCEGSAHEPELLQMTLAFGPVLSQSELSSHSIPTAPLHVPKPPASPGSAQLKPSLQLAGSSTHPGETGQLTRSRVPHSACTSAT